MAKFMPVLTIEHSAQFSARIPFSKRKIMLRNKEDSYTRLKKSSKIFFSDLLTMDRSPNLSGPIERRA